MILYYLVFIFLFSCCYSVNILVQNSQGKAYVSIKILKTYEIRNYCPVLLQI